MANVPGTFYTAETQRRGTTPVSPPSAVDDPIDPVNPSGPPVVPPVAERYASEAAMIADQLNQKSGYLYFDGTDTWWYLGTTNGDITDYEAFGGGGGVQSVTGDGVDNTDPNNPVIDLADISLSGSPYDLDQEGATDGQVLTWVSANSRYEPVTPAAGSSKWTENIYGIYRNSNVSINHTPVSGDANIPLIVKPSFASNPPTTNDNNLVQIFGSDGTKRLEFQDDGGLFIRSNAISSGQIFALYNGSSQLVFEGFGNRSFNAYGPVTLSDRLFRVGNPTSPNSDTTIKASASLAASSAFRIDSGFTNGILDIYARGNFKFFDGATFDLGTTTGLKIGITTSQKLAFWNKTPIIQPTTGITGATRVGGGGATITDTDTFGGYTVAQLAAILINTGLTA